MRYSEYGQIDDKPLVDGDQLFRGFNTRIDADNLEPGMLSFASNVRLDDGVISPRKTIEALQDYSNSAMGIQNTLLDAIKINRGKSHDEILTATDKLSFLHSGTALDANIEIDYPLDQKPTEGFLLDTNITTLLFGKPSPTLPFTEGTQLGQQVMRLENRDEYDGDGNFIQTTYSWKRHKEVKPVLRKLIVGEDRIVVCQDKPTFVSGELVNWKLPQNTDRLYKVTKVDGFEVYMRPAYPYFDNWDGQVNANPIPLTGQTLYSIDDECPSGSLATWAGNRLIVPTGTHDIAISSPLSTTDFPITNTLTIGAEDGGVITALEPLIDDSLIVFKNNSIHLVTSIFSLKTFDEGGNLSIIRVTDQVGCIHNRAKQVIGQELIFVSNQGVYGISLNARGDGGIGLPAQALRITDMPLSNDVQNLIYDGGWDFDTTQIIFHKGRLYMFCDNYHDETYNETFTACLIYNTLLAKWESLDYYAPEFFRIMQHSGENGQSKLIILQHNKGLSALEQFETEEDSYTRIPQYGLRTRAVSRGYRMNSFNNKILNRVQVSGTSELFNANPNIFNVSSENPERTSTLFNTLGTTTGSFLYRYKERMEGESFKWEFRTDTSRTKIKRVMLESREGLRNTRNSS